MITFLIHHFKNIINLSYGKTRAEYLRTLISEKK